MARVTGLEPATSGVTGRHSNQLSYTRVLAVASAWEAALYVSTGCLSTRYSSPVKFFTTEPRLACGQFCQKAGFGADFAIFVVRQRLDRRKMHEKKF